MAETLKFLVEIATDKGEAAVDRLKGKFEQLEESGMTAAEKTSFAMGQAGVAISAVGTAITAALIAMTVHTANFGDELNDLSKKTGASAETLQTLGFAAEQSGSSLEGMSTGLKFLAKNAVAAAEGNEQAAGAFKQLGVNMKDANGQIKDTDKLFLEVAERFSKIRDGAQKTALAIQIFGRSGAELIPTLNEGAAGIEKMGKQLEAVGGVLSGETAKAADDFNDQLHLLEKGVDGITLQIGTALLPVLKEIVDAIVPVVAGISAWVKAHPDLTKAVFTLGVALAGTGGLLAAVAAINIALPIMAAGLGSVWLAAAGPIAVVAALAAGAYAFRYQLGAVILTIGAFITDGLVKLVDAVAKVAGAAGFTGLHDKLMSVKFSLEETSAGWKDMATQLKAGEPVIIGNTKAVDKWKESHKEALPVIEKMSDEMKKYIDVWRKAGGAIYDSNQRLKDYVETGKANMKIERDTSFLIRDLIDKTQGYAGAQFALGETAKGSALLVQASMQKIQNDANHVMDDYNARQKKMEEQLAQKRLDTYNDLRNSAGQIFDSLVEKGGNAIGTITGLFKAGFLSLGRSVFEDVTATLFTPLKMAFDDFFTGLLESAGLKKFMSGLASKISGIIPGLGGSAATTAAGTATQLGGTAASVGGTAASAGSSVASAAGSLAGTVSAVSGVVSAVSGIIGNFQMARLEGTMNAVERNTRYTYIDQEIVINSFWWPVLGILQRGEDYWHTATMQLDAIYNLLYASPIGEATRGVDTGAGGPIGTAAATVNIPISISQQNSFYGQEMTQQLVRDFIIPEITTVLVDGVNSVREKWSSIFKQSSGLSNTAVTTG